MSDVIRLWFLQFVEQDTEQGSSFRKKKKCGACGEWLLREIALNSAARIFICCLLNRYCFIVNISVLP